MYNLYADSLADLAQRSQLFEQHMEPLLQKLERFAAMGNVPATLPEITEYIQVCRWPFRKLEYSFVLETLLRYLQPGMRFLDAGSGVTPLAHVIAQHGVHAEACDGNEREMKELIQLQPEKIYGTPVTYSVQDLTRMQFPDASFDAISCVSVLEHIPSPYDQVALRELQRILRPGGVLILTVDFTPAIKNKAGRLGYYLGRTVHLVHSGRLIEVVRGVQRKVEAQQSVSQGAAHHARSANQCLEVAHLEHDLLPLLLGQELPSTVGYSSDLRSLSVAHAARFWRLGKHDSHAEVRSVLPAAIAIHKHA